MVHLGIHSWIRPLECQYSYLAVVSSVSRSFFELIQYTVVLEPL